MRKNYGQDDTKIAEYVESIFHPDDEFLRGIRASAEKAGLPPIHVAPMDGLHLEVISAAIQARKVIEIGTLAGYSGIRILRGMAAVGEQGEFHSFELDPKHAAIAKENFLAAGFKATVWVGAAMDNLVKVEERGPFDLVFIDADKANYTNYFLWAAKNLRKGGVLLADNCFAFGQIAERSDRLVVSLREFNASVAAHTGFLSTMIPTGEGLLMAVRL